MANIQNELNNIKNAVYGKDVRDSIHNAIEQCYNDASTNGNANMEVILARGEYNNLNERLENHSSRIKDKANQIDLEIERKRIDNFTKLQDGSTTGDAELIDGRIGADGITYSNIGNSIRNQIKQIYNTKLLTYTLIQSGVRTFSIIETGMVTNKKYLVKIENYNGSCAVNKIDFRFLDDNDNVLTKYEGFNIGDSCVCELPTGASKLRFLFYIDGTETSNSTFTMSIFNYITDDLYEKEFKSIEGLENEIQDCRIGRDGIKYNSIGEAVNTQLSNIENDVYDYYKKLTHTILQSGVRTFPLTDLDLEIGKKYIVKLNNYTGSCEVQKVEVAFRDSSQTTLVKYTINNINDYVFCTIPKNTVDLRFLFYIDGTETSNSTFTMSIFRYNEEPTIKKIINCLGDSFTASSTSWHTFIDQRLGYDMINLGVAGTRISNTYTAANGTTYTGFIDRVSVDGYLNSNADMTVIFGGINDTVRVHNNQLTIGTVDDVTGSDTFCGKLKELIELIWNKLPGKPILGVIPPDYSEGTTDYEWWYENIALIQESERKVYQYYGIPYVDLKRECQKMYRNSYNLSNYRINGLSNMHPSEEGYKAISISIQKGIQEMLID